MYVCVCVCVYVWLEDAPRHRSVCVAMEGGRHHPGRDAGLRSRSRSPVVQPVVAPVLRRQAVVAPVLRRQPVVAPRSQTEPLKLLARVYAESAISGLVSTTFTLTSNTPLGKLMTTWCAHQNVDSSDACFMNGKVEIQKNTTIAGSGLWPCPSCGEVVIHVIPRHEKDCASTPAGLRLGPVEDTVLHLLEAPRSCCQYD